MEAWYFSPYPPEIFPNMTKKCHTHLVFVRLRWSFSSQIWLQRHYQRNPPRHPPGNEIYRDDVTMLSMFEVDGTQEKIYARTYAGWQNCSGPKTLYYDVDPFLFCVMWTGWPWVSYWVFILKKSIGSKAITCKYLKDLELNAVLAEWRFKLQWLTHHFLLYVFWHYLRTRERATAVFNWV